MPSDRSLDQACWLLSPSIARISPCLSHSEHTEHSAFNYGWCAKRSIQFQETVEKGELLLRIGSTSSHPPQPTESGVPFRFWTCLARQTP
jgi:hypothetical protein